MAHKDDRVSMRASTDIPFYTWPETLLAYAKTHDLINDEKMLSMVEEFSEDNLVRTIRILWRSVEDMIVFYEHPESHKVWAEMTRYNENNNIFYYRIEYPYSGAI